MRIVSGIALLLMVCAPLVAQQPKCAGFNGLLGDWIGTGSGSPGEGQGGFTFKLDLQGRVMVRRNFAEYLATKERPAFRHDDLMVLYNDSTGARRADYWDNEGHVIRYAVTTSTDGCTITFQSPTSANDAAYKLTYTFKSPDEVSIAFQVALPGRDFGNYVTASARRKK